MCVCGVWLIDHAVELLRIAFARAVFCATPSPNDGATITLYTGQERTHRLCAQHMLQKRSCAVVFAAPAECTPCRTPSAPVSWQRRRSGGGTRPLRARVTGPTSEGTEWHRRARCCVGGRQWQRDMDWWEHHLSHRSLYPFEEKPAAAAGVITGTDASGWGTGQVACLDGGREETNLYICCSRPRREASSLCGGGQVLVDTYNMAAKGAAGKLAGPRHRISICRSSSQETPGGLREMGLWSQGVAHTR